MLKSLFRNKSTRVSPSRYSQFAVSVNTHYALLGLFSLVSNDPRLSVLMEHDPSSGRSHSRLSTRDVATLFGEVEGCASRSTLFRREWLSIFFARHIRLESRVYQYVSCSGAHRMTFHASTLKCLRLCTATAMWGSCHTPVLPSIFGGDISCDAPRRRIVLAISRALLWSPDSLGVKLTIPI